MRFPYIKTAMVLAALLPAFSAYAQTGAFQHWKPVQGSGVDGCGLNTNNEMQDIPSAGFGLNMEEGNMFTLMVSGNMNISSPPKNASVRFAGRTVSAPKLGFGKLGEPNRYGVAVYLGLEYLNDLAESESFTIMLDGQNFATYRLLERGQAVAYMARCIRFMRQQ